eukprot:363203-Chlamydomonas_euryale.AAC.38
MSLPIERQPLTEFVACANGQVAALRRDLAQAHGRRAPRARPNPRAEPSPRATKTERSTVTAGKGHGGDTQAASCICATHSE